MRTSLVVVVLGLFLLTNILHAQGRNEFRPSPIFTGTALPVPPQQRAPWTPPQTTLPQEWVSATETLFAQGLADPRGCEYAAIEIGTGNCWNGDAGVMAVHGWVLPGTGPQRYAVCWNGLIYPLLSITGTADLADDVRALANEKATPNWRNACPEGYMASHANVLPLKVCLLLRLGEGRAAETLHGKMKDAVNQRVIQNPYLILASDWAWAMFDRGVCAHMRGDDQLALLDFRTLTAMNTAIEAEAMRRGLERPYVEDDQGKRIANAPYLQFLKPLPAFLTDEERRAQTPRAVPFTLSTVTAEKDQPKRIAALIEGMDEIAERQDGQPGGVILQWNPIVKALIAEGEPAVEPLIDCLEKDERLTRSVSFGRDFFQGRNYVAVRRAAFVALTEILHTQEFGQSVDEHNAAQLAARIRAYWQQAKGTTLEERWYKVLADDNATPKQWMEAAGFIVQPTNVSGIPGAGLWQTTPVKPGEVPPLRGESLRAKTNPTVSELMARRIAQIAKIKEGNSNDTFHMNAVSGMALNLAKWDLPASLPVLHDQILRCRETDDYHGMLAMDIGQMTLERLRGNDPQAVAEYAAWLLNSKPADMDQNAATALEPIWRYPADPALADLAEKLFNDPASAWFNLVQGDTVILGYPGLLNTPLLGVPGFRRHVITALENRAVVAQLHYQPNSSAMVQIPNGPAFSYTIDANDPSAANAIKDQPVRMCDLYAWKLADVMGMPLFKLEWPEAERDRIIAIAVERLRQYGARYAFDATMPKYFYGYFQDTEARAVLPRLDRPAEEEDVRQGRAIFSLPATAQRRIVSLPSVPLAAKWVTLRQYPYETQQYNEQTEQTERKIAYHQEVAVWQAEEMLVDGKWQRFFGAVGPHELVRIPAEEIEFTTPFGGPSWGQLSDGFDCRVEIGEGYQRAVNAPVTLNVYLRNRSGVELRSPSIFNLPFDDGRPSLRPGMALHLFYAPPMPNGRYPEKWSELPSRAAEGAGWRVNEAWKTIGLADSYLAVGLDLAKCFDLSQVGYYRCYVTFSKANPAFDFAEGTSSETYFTIGVQ